MPVWTCAPCTPVPVGAWPRSCPLLLPRGPAALYSVAARFLERDFIRVDELDHLSDSNLSMLTLAIQEGAPELVEAWHVILAELVGP